MSLNIKLIRESFQKAKPIAPKVVTKFYEILFSKHPEAQTLFESVNMEKQKQALIGSLVYIVDHLHQTEQLVQYLQKMGERHIHYGVSEEHYPWVGEALLETFAHFLEDAWTDELKSEWTKAYGVISEQMIKGAKEAQLRLNVKTRAQEICQTLLKSTLDQEVDGNFKELVRLKVRKVLLEVLEEEGENLLPRTTKKSHPKAA